MKNFQRAVLLTLLLSGGLLCRAQEGTAKYQGKIDSVISGNTLIFSAGDKKLHIHLLGIDIPINELGETSRKNLAKLVKDRPATFVAVPLQLDAGKRKYLVGKLFLNDMDVAVAQLTDGMAWQSDDYEKYQDPRDRQLYVETEQRAMAEKRGVWGAPFKVCKATDIKTNAGQTTTATPPDKGKPKVPGVVIVEIEIESGGVVASRALCGHPVLQTISVRASHMAKFSKHPGRVKAIMTFEFEP